MIQACNYNSIVIDNDALDDQYYVSEADLTALLNNNYVDVTGDTMTGDLLLETQLLHLVFVSYICPPAAYRETDGNSGEDNRQCHCRVRASRGPETLARGNAGRHPGDRAAG